MRFIGIHGLRVVSVTALLAATACGGSGRNDVAVPADFGGAWTGTIDVGGIQLRLSLLVTEAEGVLTVPEFSVERWNWETRRSGSQKIHRNIPVATLDGRAISLTLPTIEASYAGTLSSETGEIVGNFTQFGETFPLVLSPMSDDRIFTPSSEDREQPERPQTPEEPFPYLSEDVTCPNPDGGHTLAGTFTRPRSGGPFPAVVLISGSGPSDRDVHGGGHRPFLVLADHLTRRGIAVLRYDDRGVGESTGDFEGATSEDFASDALAAVACLKGRDDIDPRGIGLVGHSEGGLIAPMAAVRSPDVGHIVLMAGPGVKGEHVFLAQTELKARAAGAPETAIPGLLERYRSIMEILMSETDHGRAGEAIAAINRERLENASAQERALHGIENDTAPETAAALSGEPVNTAWSRYFLAHEPAEVLEQVTVPVLAINGTRDLWVPHEENLRAIEAALDRGGNTLYEIHPLPDLNHFFQHAVTGTASESQASQETLAPEVLELIADWVLKVAM